MKPVDARRFAVEQVGGVMDHAHQIGLAEANLQAMDRGGGFGIGDLASSHGRRSLAEQPPER